MDARDALRLALHRMQLDQQPSEELPGLATDALARGIDSPSLREMAGAPPDDHGENRMLFVTAMSELGVSPPSLEAAGIEVARFWAREIIDGAVSPYEGARAIWWRVWDPSGRPSVLTAFVGLASEWEDDEPHRAQYEADIIAAARRLLDEE